MSTLAREIQERRRPDGSRPIEIEPTTIRWVLAAPDVQGLRWTFDQAGARAEVLRDDDWTAVEGQGPTAVEVVRDGELCHADVLASDGTRLLAATWRIAGCELLYARTALLETLGVPGGCWELAGIE